MLEHRDSDEGVPVAYTEFKTFSDHRRLIRQAVEIGATMALADGEVVDIDMLDGFIRWEFDSPATLVFFKLKFSTIMVPAPWKDFFPD